MKKITPYLMILVMLLTLSSNSCDEDILDVDLSTTIKKQFNVQINQGIEAVNESTIFSIDTDETNRYLNKIKEVKIQKLSYKIISFSGDSESSFDGSFYADQYLFSPVVNKIQNAFDNKTAFVIDNNDHLNQVAELLIENNNVLVGLKGESNSPNGPTNLTVEITADLKITANPL